MPLSIDEKKRPLVPNPVLDIAVKALPGPQEAEILAVVCGRIHSLLPPTLQIVIPLKSPVTVQLKVKVLRGHTGGDGINCPATIPRLT